ncbi:hypothetical protein lbkm_1660 [Lachnospiraceae bacterium KM106-2]|nr:hypothetical protein lbkm_1660 [Lachnospiraceae bacterium KM106-2]
MSKERIEYLMELDEDEVEIVENQSSSTAMLFQEILKKHQDKRKE